MGSWEAGEVSDGVIGPGMSAGLKEPWDIPGHPGTHGTTWAWDVCWAEGALGHPRTSRDAWDHLGHPRTSRDAWDKEDILGLVGQLMAIPDIYE